RVRSVSETHERLKRLGIRRERCGSTARPSRNRKTIRSSRSSCRKTCGHRETGIGSPTFRTPTESSSVSTTTLKNRGKDQSRITIEAKLENHYEVPPHRMLVNDPGAKRPGVSVPTREPERPRRSLLRTAPWIGLFVMGIGLFQVGWAAKGLLASGSSLDPRTSLELGLLLDQGALSSLSGAALAVGGFSVGRRGGRARTPNPPTGSIADKGWHRSLLAIAVLLTLGVVVLSALPIPSNAIAYAPRDFDPLPPPTNLTT